MIVLTPEAGIGAVNFLQGMPSAIVRLPLVRLRRAGCVSWLLCRGCGRSSDVERDPAELWVTSIAHTPKCVVARALWHSMTRSGLDQNGRPIRRARLRRAAA